MIASVEPLLKQASPPRVLVVSGEAYFRARALDAVRRWAKARKAVVVEPDGGASGAGAAVLDELRGGSLFAEEKVVIVNPGDALVSRRKAEVEAYVRAPSADNMLVLSMDKAPAVKWLKEGAGLAALHYGRLYARDYAAWIVERGAELRLRVTSAVAAALLELVGPNGFKLNGALEKLAAVAPAGAPLDPAAVARYVGSDRDADLFEFQDALLAGDARAALRVLGRYADADMPMVYATLARGTRQLRQIALGLRQGRGEEEIARALDMHPYVVKKTAAAARRANPAKLDRDLLACRDADEALKTGAAEPRQAAELLVFRLCGSILS